MKKSLFDPNISFLNLNIVRITFALLFTAALIITIAILYNDRPTANFSYIGFNNAITIFKLPLGILAAIIPIIALLATNHRSEQTKEQIRLTTENANFSNFYKHTEEFELFIEKHALKGNPKIEHPRKLHKLIFPNAKQGDYRVSNRINRHIDKCLTEILSATEGTESSDEKEWQSALLKMRAPIKAFAAHYQIAMPSESGKSIFFGPDNVFIPEGKVRILFKQIGQITSTLRDALIFDENYTPSKLMQQVIDYDYNQLPENDISWIKDYKAFSFGRDFIIENN